MRPKRKAALALSLLLLCSAASAVWAGTDRVVDVRGNPLASPQPTSFEALASAYVRAHGAGDAAEASRTMSEIRRLRVERNTARLDGVGSRLVATGLEHLQAGENDLAEEAFRQATLLAPYLPEAHFGLARSSLRRGPLGLLTASRSALAGVFTPLRSTSRQLRMVLALIPAAILGLWGTLFVVSGTLALRKAGLLLHDLQETFGEDRGRGLPFGVFVTLFALPSILFFGWGWLPLWWMALLFVYLVPRERIVVAMLVLLSTMTTPMLGALSSRLDTLANPLFRAASDIAESQADARDTPVIEAARLAAPDDSDMPYLLASHLKHLGRYDAAAAVYREVLEASAGDAAAINNLANLEFAGGNFGAAIARYKTAIATGPSPQVAATLFYNLSLAHLQRFEYDPAREARSSAERSDATLVAKFAETWKYDKGDYAVVDFGLDSEEVLIKLGGVRDGTGRPNVRGQGSALPPAEGVGAVEIGRFLVAPLILAGASLGFWLWRGRRAFTLQCARCGLPFCRRCHLGTVIADLCTQCYHLFVVRDGVSGPARNRKLLEVQVHETRRDRMVRILSRTLPGAGQIYGGQPARGVAMLAAWMVPLAVLVVSAGFAPMTDLPRSLLPWWISLALLVPFAAVWLVAARVRPSFEVILPSRRIGPPRRSASSGEEA